MSLFKSHSFSGLQSLWLYCISIDPVSCTTSYSFFLPSFLSPSLSSITLKAAGSSRERNIKRVREESMKEKISSCRTLKQYLSSFLLRNQCFFTSPHRAEPHKEFMCGRHKAILSSEDLNRACQVTLTEARKRQESQSELDLWMWPHGVLRECIIKGTGCWPLNCNERC